MKKILFACLVLASNTFASIPTMEGLLRNPGSGEISENMVVLKLMVEEVVNNKLLQTNSAEVNTVETQKQLEEKNIEPVFLKMIYSLENEGKTGLLQVRYSGNQMAERDVADVTHIKDIKQRSLEELDLEKNVFYGITSMFALNDSTVLSQTLKKHNPEYKTNKEIMNQEKLKLLEDYKRYLQAVKDEEALKEEVPSPLKPEDPEASAKVKELLAMPMYNKPEMVELSRVDGKFFWEVKLQNFTALFFSDSHKLHKLTFKNNENEMEFIFGNYVLFDGTHHLPKIIFWKDFQERLYKIRVLSMNVFNSDRKTLAERVAEYQRIWERNKKSAPKKRAEMTTDMNQTSDSELEGLPALTLPNFLYKTI